MFSAFEDIQKNNLLPGVNFEADFGNSACNGVKGLGKLLYIIGPLLQLWKSGTTIALSQSKG